MTGTSTVARARQQKPKAAEGAPIGRRERNKLEKQRRIVAAARRLFAEQGFAETTTLQIAEAADIGTGTLFLYASSKEDLLLLIFKDEMLEVAHTSLAQVTPDQSSIDSIMAVFERMVDYHSKDMDLTRILLREQIIPSNDRRQSDVDELVRVIFRGLAKLIRMGQATGEIADRLNPKLAAQSCFSIYYFGLLRWLNKRIPREQFLMETRRQIAELCNAD